MPGFALDRFRAAFVILFLSIGNVSLAQGRGSSADNELLLAGQQTVVTATKTVQRVSDAPAAVTVITAEQIESSGATSLIDLLRYVPGVDVSEQNRTAVNVSIRGFNSQYANKLLVMVDGRSIYQEFFGGISWPTTPLLLSRIKRIEIVRGPGSVLYGANAFDGVINIILKTPEELASAPAKTTTRDLVGEQDTQMLELQASAGKSRDWGLTLGAAYNHSNGLGNKDPGAVRDSYTTPILTLDAQKSLRRGSLLLSAGDAEATSDSFQSIDLTNLAVHNRFASLTYSEGAVKTPITARFFVNSFIQTEGAISYGDTLDYDAEIQQSRDISSRNNLVYGASYRYTTSFSNITGPGHHVQNLFALYLQDELKLNARTNLFAGLRFDQQSVYGTDLTPRISLVHHLPARQSVRLSYGTAFRAPTILDSYLNLLIPIAPHVTLQDLGNTALKPEKLTSYEVGYRKELPKGFVGVNAYYNQVNDLIGSVPTAFQPSPPFPPGTPAQMRNVNVGGTHAFGFEVESEIELSRRVKGLFNYAYEDVRYSISDELFSPKHMLNAGVQAQLSRRWEAFLGAHFVGAEDAAISGVRKAVNAYTRVDARIGYRLGSKTHPWTISAVATNLFDDKHLEYPYFNAPGTLPEVAPHRRTLYFEMQGGF